MFITRKKHDREINDLKLNVSEIITAQLNMLEELVAASEVKIKTLLEANETQLRADIQKLFEDAVAADRKRRYESDEPYVEILSENFSEEGGVGLRLDWNSQFITYLKKNGFTGPTDEAIVDNWLISLSRERIAEGGSEYK